jgi:ribosomal protein L12E/L44/L45/RPP1/RPP2
LQWVNDSHGGTLSRAEYDRLSKEAFEEDPVDDEDWEDLLTTLKPANAPAAAAAAAAAAAGSGGTDGGGLQSQLTADQLVYGIENDELTFPSGDYEEILEAITALQVATAAADAKAQVEAKLEQERKQLQA